jgi:sodium-dependent dicarboxylate transporter 2/3/5
MLLLGLMIPTWFLSMWISNTATTSMMLPIITAVVDQLKTAELGKFSQLYQRKENYPHMGDVRLSDVIVW